MSEHIFKGFNIEYPVYTIQTPHTGIVLEVRCLNVAEVAKLKSSITTAARVPFILNRVVYSSIVNKPAYMRDFESFSKMITTRDREALLYGLYQATFSNEVESIGVVCQECNEKEKLNLKLSDMMTVDMYPKTLEGVYKAHKYGNPLEFQPDSVMEESISRTENIPDEEPPEGLSDEDQIQWAKDRADAKREAALVQSKQSPPPPQTVNSDILDREVRVTLPLSKIVAVLKVPTVSDEELVLTDKATINRELRDLLSELMIISRFEIYDSNQTMTGAVTGRDDVLIGYQQLPSKDRLHIFDEYKKEFGQYGVSLNQHWSCNQCDSENEYGMDITEQFFRMVVR